MVSAPAFFSHPLATLVRLMNVKFIGKHARYYMHRPKPAAVEAFREGTFALISRAYTSISLPLIQIYLGPLPVDKVLSGMASLILDIAGSHVP